MKIQMVLSAPNPKANFTVDLTASSMALSEVKILAAVRDEASRSRRRSFMQVTYSRSLWWQQLRVTAAVISPPERHGLRDPNYDFDILPRPWLIMSPTSCRCSSDRRRAALGARLPSNVDPLWPLSKTPANTPTFWTSNGLHQATSCNQSINHLKCGIF